MTKKKTKKKDKNYLKKLNKKKGKKNKNEEEMNKEIADLLKSNRKIINITPEEVIDVESTTEEREPRPVLSIRKPQSDQGSTS